MAEPGGICVSAKVAKEVERKLAFGFEPMGEQKVKNIAEPVAAFRVKLEGMAAGSPRLARSSWLRIAAAAVVALLLAGGAAAWFKLSAPAPETVAGSEVAQTEGKPSLVVLPFANLSDDKEQGYLADGITEDLTTELARVPGLLVISRIAAFTYKGKSIAPKQFAKELGIRYILEGSTRRTAGDMRINAQLIDTRTGGHVWAERFDGAWSQVFALQDKVVANVAGALKLHLVTGREKAGIAGGTSNPQAYDLFLKGLELEYRNTPDDIAKAVPLYEQALALDPDFGTASAELAWVYWNADDPRAKALGLSWDEIDTKIHEYLARASKHPSPAYYQIVAQLLTRERKSDEAIAGLQKTVALDPSDPWTFDGLSWALIFNGRPKEARAYLDAAWRLDPVGLSGLADWRHYLAGLAAFGEGRFEEAALALEKVDLGSPDPWTKFYSQQVLLSAYGHPGRSADFAKAMQQLKTVLTAQGERNYDKLRVQHFFVFKSEADIVRLLDGLRNFGLPELPPGADPQSKDRLTGAEIKSLILGRDLRGRIIATEIEDYSRNSSADGTVNTTFGSRSQTGKSWVQGDFLCNAYPRHLTNCGAIFRNPSGSFERRNEYLAVYHWDRVEFSVVK